MIVLWIIESIIANLKYYNINFYSKNLYIQNNTCASSTKIDPSLYPIMNLSLYMFKIAWVIKEVVSLVFILEVGLFL